MQGFVDSGSKKDGSGERSKRGVARRAGRVASGLPCSII